MKKPRKIVLTKAETAVYKILKHIEKSHKPVTTGDVMRHWEKDRVYTYRVLMRLVKKKAVKRVHRMYYEPLDITT